MDDDATFEARAVLAPRRTRVSRLVLLVPVLALVAVVWAGLTGPRPDQSTPNAPVARAEASASPSASPQPVPPPQVLGISVHKLDELDPQRYGPDDVLAIAGWYVPTAVTDCPALPALYQSGKLPYLRGDNDKLAFCVRSGVLYAAPPTGSGGGTRPTPGLSAVDATVVVGVLMPMDLELTDSGATQVVVLGRFVPLGAACNVGRSCRHGLIVDYVGWTPETPAT